MHFDSGWVTFSLSLSRSLFLLLLSLSLNLFLFVCVCVYSRVFLSVFICSPYKITLIIGLASWNGKKILVIHFSFFKKKPCQAVLKIKINKQIKSQQDTMMVSYKIKCQKQLLSCALDLLTTDACRNILSVYGT